MTSIHNPLRTRSVLRAAACIAALVLAATAVSAQNLQTVACPTGPPSYWPFGLQGFGPATPGAPLLRHTLSGADALCNDGTPAVIYIRPAQATFNGYWDNPEYPQRPNPPSDRWIIWLLGGGGCREEDGCFDRWCSAPGTRAFDSAGKMSSLGAPGAIRGKGIFSRRPDNDFAAYNHVLLNYCSSDNWVGSDSKASVVTSTGTTYDIEFQGEAIVDDAIASLLAGVSPDPGLPFWQGPMPPLTHATEILFVGDSAGGGGLRHHIDDLAASLTPQIRPGATINAVVDAGFTPGLWQPIIDWTTAPVADYASYLLGPVTDGHTFWGTDSSAIDASCQNAANAAAHVAIGGSHPEICYDTTYTLLNHISTPFFVAMDINDTLGRERYDNWGLLTPQPDFWSAQFDQLDIVAAFGTPLVPNPGVFGPKCNQHVRVVDNKFFSQGVNLPGGAVGPSFHDLLVNWLTGAAPSAQIQMDGNPGPFYTPSNCP